jgi:hypothetical protein
MTPLEVGMYILLAVFCAAMAIFVASCFVYASKYRRQEYPLQAKSQSVQVNIQIQKLFIFYVHTYVYTYVHRN